MRIGMGMTISWEIRDTLGESDPSCLSRETFWESRPLSRSIRTSD